VTLTFRFSRLNGGTEYWFEPSVNAPHRAGNSASIEAEHILLVVDATQASLIRGAGVGRPGLPKEDGCRRSTPAESAGAANRRTTRALHSTGRYALSGGCRPFVSATRRCSGRA